MVNTRLYVIDYLCIQRVQGCVTSVILVNRWQCFELLIRHFGRVSRYFRMTKVSWSWSVHTPPQLVLRWVTICGYTSWFVTSHLYQLILLPSTEWKMRTSQQRVLCGQEANHISGTGTASQLLRGICTYRLSGLMKVDEHSTYTSVISMTPLPSCLLHWETNWCNYCTIDELSL